MPSFAASIRAKPSIQAAPEPTSHFFESLSWVTLAAVVNWATAGIWLSVVDSTSLSTSFRKLASSIPRPARMVENISAEGTDLSFSSFDR